MTPDQLATFLREYGLPLVVVMLMVFEILVPRGRLRREEQRSDKAMDIAEKQVDATRELTATVKTQTEKLAGIETRIASLEQTRRGRT